jgi:hypothetical protein
VQEARNQHVSVLLGIELPRQFHSAEDFDPDHRHKQRVLQIVVQSITSGDAFDREAGNRFEPLSYGVMCRTERTLEVFGNVERERVC